MLHRYSMVAVIAAVAAATNAAAAQTPVIASGPGNVTSYSAQFFAALKPSTAYDMILRLPGFTLDDGSSVRGFGGAAGNVLIDSQRPTSKSDDLISILQRISASQVVQIDLIRGATPGIDMQGKTMLANVILRKTGGFTGAAQYGQYTVQGHKDPDAHLDGSWRMNGRSLVASLLAFEGHLNTEGPGPHTVKGAHGELLDKSHTRNNEPTWEYKSTGSGETPLVGGHFSAHLSFDAQPFKLTSIDRFRVAGLQEEHDRQTQNVGEIGANYTHDLLKSLSLEIVGLQQLSGTNFQSDFQTSSQDQKFHLDDRQSESIGRAVLHWQPSARLTGEAGGEFVYNSLKALTQFAENGTPIALPAANVRVSEKRGEVFGTLTWRPWDRLSAEAGLRVETSTISASGDVVSSRRLTFAKPRLILSWSPYDNDQIRIRFEREVGQLAFTQFVATGSLNGTGIVAGNPNLLPQQDWALEVALEHHFWKDGVLSLTMRRLALADVIDRAPVFATSSVFDAPGNIGRGTETDLIANFNLPLGKLGLEGFIFRGDITWRGSDVTDPTTHEIRRISGQNPLDAGLHLTQDLPRSNINWGVEFFSAALERFFRFNEIDTSRTAAFADAYVDYKPRPDIALRVQLFTANRFEVNREIFGGVRGQLGLQTLDTQKRIFGPVLFTRIRKSF